MMQRYSRVLENDGFTLMEVLVAFAILSISVILGLKAFGSSVSQIARVEGELSLFRSNAILMSRLLIDGNNLPEKDADTITIIPLSEDVSAWSSEMPHLVMIGRPDDHGEPVETIVIMRATDE